MKRQWLSSALAELDRIFEHISLDNPTAGREVFQCIRHSTRQLSGFPKAGHPGQMRGTRELVITGLPYLVVYRVTPDTVEILRVLHASTNWPHDNLQ
jgi:toxin ParE1/3/4